jgi:hypothetical protein
MRTTILMVVCLSCVIPTKASAEQIVFVVSYHNLDYAAVACGSIMQMEPDAAKTIRDLANDPYFKPADWVKDVIAGATECKSVRDPRELGRRLENELTDALAVNTRCAGVTVIRDPHPDYDSGGLSEANRKIKDQKPHWDLMLDYSPATKIFGWTLFPEKPGSGSAGALVSGEGTTSKVADAICTVVTGRGANIR